MGFLTTKELNCRQVRWAEILAEYHFKIKYIKGTNNARANTLSKKTELQGSKKLLNAMLRMDKNGKIRYNHPKLAAIYKAPILNWETRIKKAQQENPKYKDYKH